MDRALYHVTDSVDGTISNKTETIQDQIENIDESIQRLEDRIDQKLARMEQQFIAMEIGPEHACRARAVGSPHNSTLQPTAGGNRNPGV